VHQLDNKEFDIINARCNHEDYPFTFFASHFQFSVIWSEMRFGVITSKHGLAYNPMLHSGCLNFVLIPMFLVQCAELQILFLPKIFLVD
jgi:hypothetical protein